MDSENFKVDQSSKLKSQGDVGTMSRKFKIAKPSSPTFAKHNAAKLKVRKKV